MIIIIMSTFRPYEPPRSSLSRAQRSQIYNIFRSVDEHVHARDITYFFGTPDGEVHELRNLYYDRGFKSHPVIYHDTGDVGHAEDVFFEVAKVICNSEHPENWKVDRDLHTRDQRTWSLDHDPCDFTEIGEFFSWTHDGIKYEVRSNLGDDWFFKGLTVH